jgi:drug/metabolite transporter (DMT)-like permease
MKKPSYSLAIAEAIIVNLIWSSSFIIVKIVLEDLGPFTISGLRYLIGALILLPFMLREKEKSPLTKKTWGLLLLLGLSAYAVGNGAMFWSLRYLPATTVSFLMGTLTITTLIAGIFLLKEIPTKIQIIGILVTLFGTALFFANGIQTRETLGLIIFGIGVIGFTTFGVLGRKIARAETVGTLRLTTIPLALGGGVTLIIAFLLEGLPSAPPTTWGLMLILAVVNTAIGYFLYNHALQALDAFQMNIVLNLTPVWTATFSFFLFDEDLERLQMLGIVVMIAGVMLVQMKKKSNV